MEKAKITKYGIKLRYIPDNDIPNGIKLQAMPTVAVTGVVMANIEKGRTYYKFGDFDVLKIIKIKTIPQKGELN